MPAVLTHARYSFLQLTRQPSVWPKVLVLVPVTEVLPYLFLGAAYVGSARLDAFFYTNLVWSFLASTTIQCLVWFQLVARTSRFDVVLLARGGLPGWTVGFTVAVGSMYLVSTALSCTVLALVLGYRVQALALLLAMVVALPCALALVTVSLALELAFSRTFHLVNVGLDGLQVLSCVLYPLSAMVALLRPAAVLSPVTWLNEYLRDARPAAAVLGLVIAAAMVAAAFGSMRLAVRRYAVLGTAGRAA